MKAISLSVLRNDLYKGCSNGGISERFDSVLLICEDGYIDIDENNLPENLVKIVTRYFGGREFKHLEPYAAPTELGWMSGGAFAYSSDSRFESDYALSIHDRQETQEMYDRLSN